YAYEWQRTPSDTPSMTTRLPSEAIPMAQLLPDPRKPSNIGLDANLLGLVMFNLFKQLDMHNIIAAPLATGSLWYGMLLCSSSREGAFSENFTQFVSAMADQIAIIIDNRRLFE